MVGLAKDQQGNLVKESQCGMENIFHRDDGKTHGIVFQKDNCSELQLQEGCGAETQIRGDFLRWMLFYVVPWKIIDVAPQ